ncbi:beta-amylase 1, chloroplastic-like [Typha latifolia]|uniref:beta-amylase 1, chloroplastic-like n=1 Tax=Typha latifolia TaxID=4733 RepID=UPI003C2BECF2
MTLNLVHRMGTLYRAPGADGKGEQRAVVRKLASAAGPNTWRLIRQKPIRTCGSHASPASCLQSHVEEEKPKGKNGVGVYVMLPLDTAGPTGVGVVRRKAMAASLAALKCAGVEGVTVDVWWGLAEREAPGVYEWGWFAELMEMAKRVGLKVQVVMSFHRCGGNDGDSVTIPLPRWVVEEMEKDPDLAYTDRWGRRNYECVSLGCDALPVIKGRTPVRCYADFMRAFRDHFAPLLGSTIVEIQVGMGPAGELRYPSYLEIHGTRKFPGIGAFQCYDKYILSSLKAAAEAVGKPEWGHSGPTDAGTYNDHPNDAPFFRRDGGWRTPYGDFFLSWYSQSLLDHCEHVLSSAASIFPPAVTLSVKVAGIHWHYAAELTAGFHNTLLRDGYAAVARALARHGALLNITCLEMRDAEQARGGARCGLQGLVRQVAAAARAAGVAGVGLSWENPLPRYDPAAYDRIAEAAREEGMVGFTYLRMGKELFEPTKWGRFVGFVRRMGEGRKEEKKVAKRFVYDTRQLVNDANS